MFVNNAGAAYFGIVEDLTPEAIEKQYDVNVFGPMRVSRAFLPGMRERRSGLVVYVSSVVGRLAMPFIGVYLSSKWALALMGSIMSGLNEAAATRDSRDVAEAIFAIAYKPAGTRPLRTPVPDEAGVAAINATHEAVQRDVLVAMGLEQLLPGAAKIGILSH